MRDTYSYSAPTEASLRQVNTVFGGAVEKQLRIGHIAHGLEGQVIHKIEEKPVDFEFIFPSLNGLAEGSEESQAASLLLTSLKTEYARTEKTTIDHGTGINRRLYKTPIEGVFLLVNLHHARDPELRMSVNNVLDYRLIGPGKVAEYFPEAVTGEPQDGSVTDNF